LPIQTAFGGYIFGADATGAWNPDDVGLDSEGEIAGSYLDGERCS
jgi:maltose-binding protein MalE